MSRQIFGAIKYGSLPVLGVGLLQVRADSNPELEQMAPSIQRIKAKELPVYGEPGEVEYQLIPEGQSSLRDAISVVRKQVWALSASCQGAIDMTKKTYKATEETFQTVVKFIKTEEGFYPRAGVISIAGLTGLVIARRGGIVKKVLYSGGLMTAATSLCYPYKAVRIAKSDMEWVKTKASELYKGDTTTPAIEKVESLEATEETKAQVPEMEASNEEPSKPQTMAGPSEVDHGQSKPEDKDMYTTRS